jgi:hypothetical protein
MFTDTKKNKRFRRNGIEGKMTRRKLGTVVIAAIVAVMLLQQCGCTLIGLGIGSTIDRNHQKEVPVDGWQIADVPEGTKVTVVLNDGSSIIGKLCGVDFAGSAGFQDDYVRAQQEDSAAAILPALGDTLVLKGRWGSQIKGKFVGVDRSREKGQWEYWFKIAEEDREEPRLCRLSDVHDIRKGDGSTLAGLDFGRILNETVKTPISAISVCGDPGGSKSVQASDINHITFIKKGKAAQTGFLIGLAVDATIVAVAIITSSNKEQPYQPPSSDSISCPYVYSFDGTDYRLDAEPLGASFCRAFARTDWVELHNLRVDNGECKIRITNELPETEFLNEVKLLAIDHPPSTRVIYSATGQLHTIVSPQAPIQATDYYGSDQLNLVNTKDDQFWTSNPFGRNPDNASNLRDGLELEFTKPADAGSVKLALNVRNTSWGAEMLHETLMLLGDDAASWYATLETSPMARLALKQALIREGMLQIKIWNGHLWKDADFVWGIGPKLFKDQVFELDLTGIPGDRLKLRLESTAGFWAVDNAIVDYSPDLPANVTELPLAQALDYQTKDLRQCLSHKDSAYYVMASNADRAELSFVTPASSINTVRSFMVKCTGYYETLIPSGTRPQIDRVSHFINEPNSFGMYALGKLNGELATAAIAWHVKLISRFKE